MRLFLFLLKNRLWVLVRTASLRWFWGVSTVCSWAEIREILEFFSENFQFLVVKFSFYLNRPAQNIYCGYLLEPPCGYSLEPPCWGGSNEYPQSVFFSRNKKKSIWVCFLDEPLMPSMLDKNCSRRTFRKKKILIFPRKLALIFQANCLGDNLPERSKPVFSRKKKFKGDNLHERSNECQKVCIWKQRTITD